MPAARSRRGGELAPAKPRADAYVGMLTISLVVLGIAMLFAFLDKSTYPDSAPPKVQVAPRAAQTAPPTAAPQAAQPMPGVQQGMPQVAPQPGQVLPPSNPATPPKQ